MVSLPTVQSVSQMFQLKIKIAGIMFFFQTITRVFITDSFIRVQPTSAFFIFYFST